MDLVRDRRDPDLVTYFIIHSYMQWPTDEQRRKACATLAIISMMGLAEEDAAREPRNDVSLQVWLDAHSVVHDYLEMVWLQSFGGYAAIRNPGQLQARLLWPLNEWWAIAFAFEFVRTLAASRADITGGPSLRKARYAAVKIGRKAGLPSSNGEFDKLWAKYRSVAPLCAALYSPLILDQGYGELTIGTILSIARCYQIFASTFCPKSRSAPLIPADSLWLVPDSLKLPAAPVELISRPLPDAWLQLAREMPKRPFSRH